MIFDKDLSVLGCRKEGISLPLSMIEHWVAKKELNKLVFFETGNKSIFVKNTGYFFYYYGRLEYRPICFGAMDSSINFLDKQE